MEDPSLTLGLPEQDALPETPVFDLSEDQDSAYERIAGLIERSGLTLAGAPTAHLGDHDDIDEVDLGRVFAVLGKAGSGKTQLLAMLTQSLIDADAVQIGPDGEGQRAGKRSFAVVAPTNKAASVLRQRGVAATTIHRIIYTPVYDPEYEKIAEWLRELGKGERPSTDAIAAEALDRALEFYRETLNQFRAHSRPLGSEVLSSSRAGQGGMMRSILGLSMKPQCSTKSSWTTYARCSAH